ncbi:MAG: hypothetical protein JWN78_886 [Bacteroidota bacterium]|nr:hypothetical protein [Bacteroidota bacterium]
MTTEFIALLANLALTLSVVVALIFGIAQVKMSNRDRQERLTLDALRNFQTREFAELINFITNVTFPETYEKYLSWTKNEQVCFIQLAQQMESLGILLAIKVINFDLVDKTLGSFVTSSWEKYKPLMLLIREEQSDPYSAEYFQWMAEQIDERMKKNQREPFYLSKDKF